MPFQYVFIVIVAIVAGFGWVVYQRESARSLASKYEKQLVNRDEILSWLLNHYQLTTSQPYLSLPGFDEKRCYFCQYPTGERHHPECPWQKMQPIVAALFPTVSNNIAPRVTKMVLDRDFDS